MSNKTTTPTTAKKQGRAFSAMPNTLNTKRRYHPTELEWNGQYWEPRLSLSWLDQLITSVPYLGSALQVKRNYLLRCCKLKNPSVLNRQTLRKYIEDVLSFGNGYLEPEYNPRGKIVHLNHRISMWIRKGVGNEYWLTDTQYQQPAQKFNTELWMYADYDRRHEIYGLPSYVSALHSALLNQAATVFRVEFSENKGLVRFILHVTADLDEAVMDSIEEKFKSTRGFSIEDMLIHDPEGKPDGIKLIPIMGDIAKDDFLNVSKVSKQSICVATRVPLQLLAETPENAGGFGNVMQAAQAFVEGEIAPLYQLIIEPITDAFGDVVEYEPIQYGNTSQWSDRAHNPTPDAK